MKKISKINDYLRRKQSMVLLFPAGFIVGIILGIFVAKVSVINEFAECWFLLLADVTIHPLYYLCYVFRKRVEQLLFLLVLAFLPFGPALYYFFLLVSCMLLGIVFACFCSVKGLCGFLIAMANCFPQDLFYGIALFYGFDFFYGCWSKIQKNDLGSQKHRDLSVVICGVRMNLFSVLVLVAIIGFISECYVNPFLLKFLVNIILK